MNKLIKLTLGLVGGLLGVVVALFAIERYAAESGEVVVLFSQEGDGTGAETRLWVVDLEGYQYLRVGADGSGWYERLVRQPQIQLQRGGGRQEYRVTFHPELSAAINGLMQEKYGWRDSYIGNLVGGRENSIAIRLNPAG